MINEASERLKRLNGKIMGEWEKRACAEVKAATHQNSLALRNSLPLFLGQVEKALSTTIDRTAARVRMDRKEDIRIGQKHGRERANMQSYTMDQLIFEYHILRQVICDTMEEESPLSALEREVIVCAVEQAVNDAATEFSETLRDVQEKFTQTLAHDLRSPITAAKLNAQLIVKAPEDAKKVLHLAKRIGLNMDRLDLMIHDLLDAGKLRVGQALSLEFADCDMDHILSQVVEEINLFHDGRVKYVSEGSAIGCWNALGLRRVIDNLVSNAVKFSDAGTPITLKLKRCDDSIETSVHNFGKMISSEDMSILFEQYKRSKSSSAQKGWGLGLAVVKGISEAHKGDVKVVSNEKGTTFTVTLPWTA